MMRLTLAFLCWATTALASNPFERVDPMIGTANEGQTIPVVGMPFAMTGWTPETRATEDKCVAPYYYDDKKITGFRGTHWISGSCVAEYGSLTLMPTTGEIVTARDGRASEFRHDAEISNPAYYKVLLDRYHVQVELTGTERAGIMRIHFPPGQAANIVFEPYVKHREGLIRVIPRKNEIAGYNPVYRQYLKAGDTAGFRGYFVARFDHAIRRFGTWCDDQLHVGQKEQTNGCSLMGGFASFANGTGEVVVRIGTSFTSLEQAEKNLDKELGARSFDEIRADTKQHWERLLNRIEVSGGSEQQQITFYTALYHSLLQPRIVSDADGTYNGFANQGKLHKAPQGQVYYDDYSLWDTYRALHPLLTIIDPEREEQMVASLIEKGRQGGFLPIFPAWNSYTSEMVGDHATAVIADAYAKGLRNFDVAEAYRLAYQNATVVPPKSDYQDGKGRRALDSYLHYHYIPLEDEVLDAPHKREQVSRTLEYAYDDYVMSLWAGALKHTSDAAAFRERSEYWRNVIDPQSGFARGRHADGSWVTPFEPDKEQTYITEGLPFQYTFFVPQNIEGLIQGLGGRGRFIAKLDELFARHLYDHGNEPSHHIAYLYDYAQAAGKTESHVRDVMNTQYGTGPKGLPGNDDSGQMSAWYVLSAMGFYPVCPGKPEYAIGSPLFSHIVIHQRHGKDFTIDALNNSPRNLYIQSVERNGRVYRRFLLQHSDIADGARFTLHMGSEANAQPFEQ